MPLLANKKLLIAKTLSLTGLFITLYLIYLHYQEGSAICNLSDTFNCDIVNKSQFSEIFGIPVAALGALYYLGVCITLFFKKISKNLWYGIIILSIIGVIFSLYLTATETFYLYAYCIFCLIHQINIIILTGLLISLFKKN